MSDETDSVEYWNRYDSFSAAFSTKVMDGETKIIHEAEASQ